ncbi:hypothetical protein GCM10022389_28970 [Flavobacterium cheonanense]|uniref:Uncharacterized protein n=1 Tax=Flavobacterium cheonanense TaxID=706183 RepID=A0ABP7W5X4_9FLAO
MKEYFKYANGYVNINDENLFLTNSGNWSETHDLLEKSPKSIRKNDLKSLKIYNLHFIIVCIGLLMYSKLDNVFIPFAFSGSCFGAYLHLIRETGKCYKIPISKIISFDVSNDKVKILFRNANNIDDFEAIFKVDTKGLAILEEFSRQLKIN